jgi:hypothetical protein
MNMLTMGCLQSSGTGTASTSNIHHQPQASDLPVGGTSWDPEQRNDIAYNVKSEGQGAEHQKK